MADPDDEDGEEAEEKPVKGAPARPTITLHPSATTLFYLKELVALGMYGKTPTTAANRLIDEGIRRAICDQLIDKRRAD